MSDILIKGMEMPKCCDECPMSQLINDNQYAYCHLLKEGTKVGYMLRDCPLVEVPPHGRLIDADALLPKSGYDPMMFKHKYDGDHRTQYDTLMGYEILGIVEDAHTVLEAST